MTNSYAKACNEVLVLLKTYLSAEEYKKIPKEKILFYERNRDVNYTYELNIDLALEEQAISEKANTILITIFRDYFATEKQQKILENILLENDKKKEIEKSNRYDSNNIFKQKEYGKTIIEETALVEYKKENWFVKFLKKVLNISN